MKTIMNGKKYDTETATEIGSCDDYHFSDFRHYEESLYQKKTGEFFLAGSGGPASKYREHCSDGSWCEGSGIIPLSLEEAQVWGENHLSVSHYEEVFGEVGE